MALTNTGSNNGSGWTCLACGMLVQSGQFHNCVELYPDTPDVHPVPAVSSYTSVPVLERIASALERIANRLERK